MTAHSKFSASAAERWLACPGSVVLSQGKVDRPSVYAARGTVAHTLLENALLGKTPAVDREGEVHEVDGHTIIVDHEMIANVQWALQHIAEITHGCDIVEAETRVNYADHIGVPTDDGFGTSDVIAVNAAQRELLVADYKNGRKPVNAVENAQMMLYAGGALAQYEDVVDIDTVRMVILQPEAGMPKEHVIPVADLKAWLQGRARSGAASVLMAERMYADASDGALHPDWQDTFLKSGDHCQWCKAKATCPKLRGEVAEAVFNSAPATPGEFESFTANTPDIVPQQQAPTAWLSAALSKVDLIEDWCKAVRAEVERRLAAGEPVPGFKLVQGKKGNRQWADAKEAEKLLRGVFRLPIEKAYDLKLISPTTAEKLAKAGDIGPRQWPKAQALITQKDGAPHVAPESDPRSAITVQPVAEMFEAQAGEMV